MDGVVSVGRVACVLVVVSAGVQATAAWCQAAADSSITPLGTSTVNFQKKMLARAMTIIE